MNFRPLIAFSILAPCLTSTTLSFAQLSLDDDSRNDIEPTSPFATAAKVENTPYLDGEVLDDDVWEAAKPVTGFWQTTPNERQPVSEKTELRIVYTNRTLYFDCKEGTTLREAAISLGHLREKNLINTWCRKRWWGTCRSNHFLKIGPAL
ncbi:hypothetical protein IIA28_16210 [candidate division KSB1 bacterium]|nr:hypothetical protein [candidate division KSB1 bacterium]